MKPTHSNPAAASGALLETAPAVLAAAAAPSLDAWSYWVDAWQRNLLFLDVMRQRSERYAEHAAKKAPHVLKFECDLVVDGRKLQKPVNYALVRIRPAEGAVIDPKIRVLAPAPASAASKPTVKLASR
jgi:hypothetical protein